MGVGSIERRATSLALAVSLLAGSTIAVSTIACGGLGQQAPNSIEQEGERQYLLESVDDAAVVQLYADGFASLSLRDKTLIYHLYEAALAGRDIYYDQRYAHSLEMRSVLEEIITHPQDIDPQVLGKIRRYTKLFWINTGPYNQNTARKFVLRCSPEAFSRAANLAAAAGARFALRGGETLEEMLARLQPMFFDLDRDPVVTNKSPGPGKDILLSSANNLYVGVSMKDLEGFDERYGLNSRLITRDGELFEEIYRSDGKYGAQINAVVEHLEDAIPFASQTMAQALEALIAFYRSGEDSDRRAYDIAWVQDKDSPVDTINGFIEVYMDSRGVKGSWEALVFYVNEEKTRGIQRLAEEAQWFEDRMPWDAAYRKQGVRGITANAIDVVIQTGESGPVSPIGINLPNDQTIREQYGSKSISLSNVIEAYAMSSPTGFRSEFPWSPEEVERSRRWGALARELTTNMHEVIGHASGQLAERLGGNSQSFLKEYYSATEEGRADLVALYFIADPKLVELDLIAAVDQEDLVRAAYEGYTRNALVQLRRMREGTQIEQDHMRNRQMVVHWMLHNTNTIDVRQRDGKTYYVLVDPDAFREGVGRLLAEVQRIKSEGDYEAAQQLFESYGIHFDPDLRDEVVGRVDQLDLPSYTGFVQPRLTATRDGGGAITDVEISYPLDLTTQMLGYSGNSMPD